MDKRTPSVEWYIAQSDADWAHLREPPLPDGKPTANRCRPHKRYFWSVAALLLLLASAGGWWHSDQASLPQATVEVMATAQPEPGAAAPGSDPRAVSLPSNQWEREWWRQFGQAYSGRRPASQTDEPDAYGDVTLQTVEFAGDQAVARVITIATARGRRTGRPGSIGTRLRDGCAQSRMLTCGGRSAAWKPRPSSSTFASKT
jgi:hypothetical protein